MPNAERLIQHPNQPLDLVSRVVMGETGPNDAVPRVDAHPLQQPAGVAMAPPKADILVRGCLTDGGGRHGLVEEANGRNPSRPTVRRSDDPNAGLGPQVGEELFRKRCLQCLDRLKCPGHRRSVEGRVACEEAEVGSQRKQSGAAFVHDPAQLELRRNPIPGHERMIRPG